MDVVLGADDLLSQGTQVVLEVIDSRRVALEAVYLRAGLMRLVGGVDGEAAALLRRLLHQVEPALDLCQLVVHPGEGVAGEGNFASCRHCSSTRMKLPISWTTLSFFRPVNASCI